MHANHCGALNECRNLTFLNYHFSPLINSLQINNKLKKYDYKGEMSFSRNGDNIYFKELFNDTIYNVITVDNKLQAKYAIDFGRYRLPDNFKYSSTNSTLSKALNYSVSNNLTLGIHDFYISDSILFFRYGKPQLREVFIDFNTNKSISFDRSITQNFFLIREIKAVDNNYFLKVISSEIIHNLLKTYFNNSDSTEFRSTHREFYELTKKIDSGSNGLITFLKVKL